MADVELLPLPEYFQRDLSHMTWEGLTQAAIDYARANMEPLRAEVESLRHHGTLLSNIAYNLAQDDRLSDAVRWSLDDARKRWDAALAAANGGGNG